MTKDEAIEQIKWYFEEDDGIAAEDVTKEAIDMAIEALSAENSSTVDKCDGCLYEDSDKSLFPCTYCKRNHFDKYEKDEFLAERPKEAHCRECVRKKNCWMFDEHKDDNGTCLWAEPYYITESANDAVGKNDEVIERPIIEHDREWIIGCIKHDGFIKTDRFDKANQIILDALADRPSGEWLFKDHEIFAGEYFCSICGKRAEVDLYGEWILSSYCPSCGTYMGKKGGAE